MDIASQEDKRGVLLDEVGVREVKIPISVLDKERDDGKQYTIGTFNAFVELPDKQRGTHMSRIVEIIYNNRYKINGKGLMDATKELADRLNATESRIQVTFPYFVTTESPKSKLKNSMVYQARFDMKYKLINRTIRAMSSFEVPYVRPTPTWEFKLGVDVDVMTVCPCALEECENGNSHVQRGVVKIDVEPVPDQMVWLEDLITIAERSGSTPVYERLKRKDEAYLVKQGFKNPQFVEDVVRDAAILLAELPINGYMVSCENFESIHQHNAYARKVYQW